MEQELSLDHTNELPERSNNVITLVLTADNHLGHNALSQQPRKNKELQKRLRRAFQQATDFAIGQGVDLFIQAGDLFDAPNPSEQERSFVAARLAQLKQAGIRTFAIGGLHDTPSGNDAAQSVDTRGEQAAPPDALAPQESFARLGALHYFSPKTSELEPVIVDIRGVRVGLCGLGWQAGPQGDPLAEARVSGDIERAGIPILILHAPIEGLSSQHTSLEQRGEVSRACIEKQSSFRVILAGYEHRYHHLRLGECEVIVAGATQHIDFQAASGARTNTEQDETVENGESSAAPGFVFVGLAADGLRWCRHIPIDALSLRELTIQASELWPADASAPAPTDLILDQLRPLCAEDTLVRLRLEGTLTRDQYHQLNLNQVRRYGKEHCFALVIDDSGLALRSADAPADHIERLSAREELIALADEWIAAAADEQEQHALRATKEELLAAMDSR